MFARKLMELEFRLRRKTSPFSYSKSVFKKKTEYRKMAGWEWEAKVKE